MSYVPANTSAVSLESPLPTPNTPAITAVAALQSDARWMTASADEREVLRRIAQQRDRLAAAQQAQQQAQALRAVRTVVPADAPLAERLITFAKLHPYATAGVAAVALMIGPRKLLRYGTLALPLISKLKR